MSGFALLMEQGTGKTLSALAVLGRGYLDGKVKRALIVAPASVVPVWRDELNRFASFPCDVLVLEGPVKKRIELLNAWSESDACQIAVTNYEGTWRMEEELKAWAPDMIIADESQRIKAPGTNQSRCMHRLGKKAPYKLILTGTPISQSPLDFFSQYKFLDSSIFGNSFYSFRNRYAVMGGYGNHQILGFKNLEELKEKAHSIAFRVTKKEALDLPEQIDQVRYCTLERKAMQAYKQLSTESVAEFERGDVIAPNILTKLLRLTQLTGGFVGLDEGGLENVSTAKLELLEETLEDVLIGDKKVVIFARFIPEILAIEKLLDKKGLVFRTLRGDVPMQARGELVNEFQNSPEVKVIIAQIQCAGLGITLTAADTAIFYSMDFSYANYDQCKARIHRIGQKFPCNYIHLIANGTVDEKILATLKEKRDIAREVVDNWRGFFTN